MRKSFLPFIFLLLLGSSFALSYYKQINVTNGLCLTSNGQPYCTYEIPITLNSSLNNGSDVRAYNDTNGLVSFPLWRADDWNYATASGFLWVNVTNGTSSFYVFYNTSASDASSIKNIHSCSDDFNGASLNTTIWGNGSNSFSGGILTESPTTVAARLQSTCGYLANGNYETVYRFNFGSGESYTGSGGSLGAFSDILFQKSGYTHFYLNNADLGAAGTTLNSSQWYFLKYFNPASGNSAIGSYYTDGTQNNYYSASAAHDTHPHIAQFSSGSSQYDFMVVSSYFPTQPTFTIGAQVANSSSPPPGPTNTLSVTPLTPANGSLVQNKTQNLSYSVNSSWLPTPANVLLYLDGALIANNTTTTNATLANLLTTTHGVHSWYVFAYNSTNLSMNATSGNSTFEVQFNVSAIGPANGTILQGNSTLLYYSTQNLYGINCTTYLDGSNVDYQVVNSSSAIAVFVNASSGSHSWLASCVAGDNPSYVKNISTLLFSMNFASYNNTLNLTTYPENVLASPQALFYDINGSLNVLYFSDDGGFHSLHIKTIENNSVTCDTSATMQPTSAFMLALREINQTVLLSFNSSDSTQARLTNFSSCALQPGTGSFPYAGAGANSNYDPYTYAYTKQYPALDLTGASYYLFAVPLPNGTGLFRKNVSSGIIYQVGAQFPSSYAPAWQTIANSSNLSGWYYLEALAGGSIGFGYYDGSTRSALQTLDAQAHTAGQLNQSIGIFESYGGKTYAMLANLGNTTIYLVEDNRTLTLNENISQPSHFFFVDEYTFLFFNTQGSATYAYSCYFATAANCTKFTATEYGLQMPYERGSMATAKRDGTSDVVAKGIINSGSVVQLLYNLNTYDAKYRCYNEMDEARKTFTVQIYTNSTSNILKNDSWGYVIPSANLGSGLKKSFFICANSSGDVQPQRMFLSGLTSDFVINAYSLNNGLGAYYTITVVDEFGQPVPGAKISAYRFSPLNNAFVVIEQAITDSTGSGVLYLQPFTLYRLTIEQAGYVTLNFDFTPTAVTTVNIRLSSASSPLQLPNFYYLWDDISYSLTPSTSFSTNATNVTYQVSSNSSGLEYYGLEVIRTFPNGTSSVVYSNNVSGQPSGGILTYPITTQGSYSINPYFKLQNFSQYEPLTKIFKYQNSTMGFLQARDLFNQTQPITGWVFYLIAVVVAMLAVGFASKYTGDGAGLVGLAVLWGFSLFNPAVEIVCVAGLAGTCITPVIATAFATVATIAALYAKQYL